MRTFWKILFFVFLAVVVVLVIIQVRYTQQKRQELFDRIEKERIESVMDSWENPSGKKGSKTE